VIYSHSFRLDDVSASEHFGITLARTLDKTVPVRVYFEGSIGSGKTTIIRALLRELGVKGPIKSPTFSLLEPYICKEFLIHHFDLYRLSSPEELEYLGWRDSFAQAGLCCVEWASRAGNYLPLPDMQITLSSIEPDGRLLAASAYTSAGEKWLKAIESA